MVVDDYNMLHLGVLEVTQHHTNEQDSSLKKRKACRCPDDEEEEDPDQDDKDGTRGDKEGLLELMEQEALFASLGRMWASSNLPDSILSAVEQRFG